jgi:hypothetical protein
MAERELPHLTLFEMLMYERRRHRDVRQWPYARWR